MLTILAVLLKGLLAELVLAAAFARRESRGTHFRRDFPAKNDAEFRRHIVYQQRKEGSAG